VRVAILSDTHFPARGSGLPPACRDAVRAADLAIHAGDLADMDALHGLRAIGTPVVAVHGNADDASVRAQLPPTAFVDLPGVRIAVVHNGGPEEGRLGRMRRKFPDAGGVVFGHSHVPLHQVADDGFFILNPGSATDRRRQPRHSMAVLDVREGSAPRVRFLDLDADGAPLDPALVRRPGAAH
jgi:hypothetical protein